MADLGFLAEDWPAISRRLDEALLLDDGQREAWLAALGETEAFKDKLRRLLTEPAGVETADLLDALPKLTLEHSDEAVAEAADSASAGMTVGPYRLLRELGIGGMGQVWLAERVDGGLKRLVALKLPRVSWARGLGERMQRERDILVSLDHPNIARIHDAGVDAQGRPYLALEYVEGEPIDVHCKLRALPLGERLALLLQVARAVAHAHARLVVHRDLKPANILVDGAGQVRLLDFGIAKLLEGELTQETQLTQQVGRALTLDYASPEQIRGEPIGTASDVYSLGVVAYELLTDAKPYALKRQSAAALEEAIADVDVRPASTAATGAAARKALKGDLDAILNKALKKSVAERYPTVEAFAQDIERHRANLQVQARPDALGYRARKFLRRNQLAAAAAAAVSVAVVAGAGVSLWQASVAATQRDRALAMVSRSNAVTEFLGLFVTETAQSDHPVKLADMLARSEAMAEKQFEQAPDERAVVLAMLGMYHDSLGDAPKAEALLLRAMASARGSSDASLKTRLACQHATVLQTLGRLDEARKTLEAATSRMGADTDADTAAECFAYLSYVLRAFDDGPGALVLTNRALAFLRASPRSSPGSQATLVGDLASGLQLAGRPDEASRAFAKALQLFAQLGREAGAEAITVRGNWGQLLVGAGDTKAALALYDGTIDMVTRLGGAQLLHHEYAGRAIALQLMGRYSDAASAFARCLTAAEKGQHLAMQGYCLQGLGYVAHDMGDLQGAAAYLQRIERLDALARAQGGSVGAVMHNLRARIALTRGDLALARAEFSLVLAQRNPNWATIRAFTGRAQVALQKKELVLAASDAKDALQLAQQLQGGLAHSVHTGLAWLVTGDVHAAAGNPTAAHDAFVSAVNQLTNTVDASHPALKRAQSLAAGGT